MKGDWIEARFPCGSRGEVIERDGYTNGGGLGIFLEAKADPPGGIDWCDDIWCIAHFNTGHAVARVEGTQAAAFQLGEEIADVGDWTFVGPTDWQATQPDLQQRVTDVVKAYIERGAFMLNKGYDADLAATVYTARGPKQDSGTGAK